MMRDLWIPVAGTVAALIAVLVARGSPTPPEPAPGPSWHGGGGPLELRLRLEADGALVDTDDGARYPDANALLSILPEDQTERTVVALETAAGVETQRLTTVADALRARCDVRIEQRDDETQDLPRKEDAEEGREGPAEEGAQGEEEGAH